MTVRHYRRVAYATSSGVVHRLVAATDGPLVLTASGHAIDVGSGAAAGARIAARMATMTQAHTAALSARVEVAASASRQSKERADAAERKARGRAVSAILTEHARANATEDQHDTGTRPSVVWHPAYTDER